MPNNNTPETKPQPVDLDAFNLDAFIDGVEVPSKTVPVTSKRALGQQLQEAMQAVLDLQRDEANTKAEGGRDRRRLGGTASPELDAAHAHVADLEAKIEGSFVFVRVEGTLDTAIRDQALADAKADDGSVSAYNRAVLSMTGRLHTTDPRTHPDSPGRVMSFEEWTKFAKVIGFKQWDAVVDAIVEVNTVGVSLDFSQPASHSPDGGESSES